MKRHLRGNADSHIERPGIIAVESNLNAFVFKPGVGEGADAESPIHSDRRRRHFR